MEQKIFFYLVVDIRDKPAVTLLDELEIPTKHENYLLNSRIKFGTIFLN